MNAGKKKKKLGKQRRRNQQQNNQEKFLIFNNINFQILRTHCPFQWWKKLLKKPQLCEILQHSGQREDLTNHGQNSKNQNISRLLNSNTGSLKL